MFTPYQPRPVAFLGLEPIAGYHLKTYAIRYGDRAFERERFVGAWEQAVPVLPRPAVDAMRPGAGFAILHQGRTADYFVLCWWDNENELPTRIFLSGVDGWRPANGRESFCVWDLRIIWHEREAYVATVLSGQPVGLKNYLAFILEGSA